MCAYKNSYINLFIHLSICVRVCVEHVYVHVLYVFVDLSILDTPMIMQVEDNGNGRLEDSHFVWEKHCNGFYQVVRGVILGGSV